MPAMPVPRRVSEVRSPAPGSLDAFQPAYSRNIDRLERSAEELSQGGSDIGEEIRKMSRQNSIQSSHKGDISVVVPPPPRRMGSGRSRTSSYANNTSIVDVNSNARWGGYSPGGFITSPTGSVRSGSSWTQASMNRAASGTQSSRLAQMVEPLQEGRPLDSPLAPSSASIYSQEQHMSRQASQSSFSRRYDQIAGQIEESLQAIPHTPSPDHYEEQRHDALEVHDTPDRPHSTDTFQEAQIAFKDFDGVHFDPDSEEFVELDDHGNELRRVSARTSSGSLMNAASILKTPRARPDSYTIPPPRDSMVYYPAPVPRMLNLPKRLSQLPAAHVQAKRRSEMLNELPAAARQSAPWIPPIFGEDGTSGQPEVRSQRSGSGSAPQQDHPRGMLNERMSMANAQNMPPQLRASVFFEHQPIGQDVEVKSESAVATLDSILQASTTAPVSAFTNHPYAGDVRKTVYAPERPHQRKSTATTLNSVEKEKKLKKRRSSSIGNFFRRNSTDLDGEMKEEPKSRPVSRGSMLDFNEGGNKLRKRKSQMSLGANSLGDELERAENKSVGMPEDDTTPDRRRQTMMSGGLIDQVVNSSPKEERVASGSRPASIMTSKVLTEAQQIEEDFKEREGEEDIESEEEDPIYAQPTTLLAELQVRKAQLKSRNRTAATAYPDGMHSTLLQLDAVEQINAKKRQKQRVALAWEDPTLRAEEEARKDEMDEDVPLGVLFPGKDGLINRKLGDGRDWSRPLGLMERRELEDNEPLANRRTRLNPSAVPLKKAVNTMSQMHLAGQPDADEMAKEEEDAGETLGQRLRRLKTKDALDSAISNVAPKDGERPESTFTADVLDQFPELNIKDGEAKEQDKDKRASLGSKKGLAVDEEETLGQRRARLQREREASGEQAPARPPLRQSQSMANLLSANPIGQRAMSKNQEAAQGTLLHTANQQQMKARQDLLNQNVRSASYGLEKPLVDARPNTSVNVSGGLIGGERSRPANGAFAGGTYNTSGYGMTPMDNSAMMDPLNNRHNITSGLVGAQRSRPANGAFVSGAYTGLPTSTSMPMFPGAAAAPQNPYFASPTAGMYGQMQMQPPQQMHAPAYYALTGAAGPQMSPAAYNPLMGPMGAVGNTYGYGAQQQMNVSMGLDGANLDSGQRAAIDRWRMGIA
ncbi:hypothetical protein M409DRAFT_68545 [Zasmidium cellare ATCC 36951]|uniref:Uncharacterized protein n=1 Tax=Zasmidium cellare ATCC 36951 TaxID=1080233 RepID=A0A6A6CCR1_ZASCE|nr:uncharacterized protein M409DRAFT_68545 [Zasmidium cellare ATCC 36951]KAF2163236.1 hypothetical protein M409DRAFT_68545 [Zasmidium cellare ATCC 36951]